MVACTAKDSVELLETHHQSRAVVVVTARGAFACQCEVATEVDQGRSGQSASGHSSGSAGLLDARTAAASGKDQDHETRLVSGELASERVGLHAWS